MKAIDRIPSFICNLTIVSVTIGLLNSNLALAKQISSRELLQYPPKVIASRQAVGRLQSFVWGDYFYAKFVTRTETITFFIDSLEDCLLKKYRSKIITIRYDTSDIYLPQASGYHRVNLIKKVEDIDVKQWQKLRSRSQLQQCMLDRSNS
jgi:hypothetical protein